MSYSSNYNLNIRLSALESLINSGSVTTNSNLEHILQNGNSAGNTDIDLNFNNLLNADNIQTNTINGSAVPSGLPNTLQEVLTANNITDLSAEFRNNLSTPTYINTINSIGMSNNNDLALSSGVNMTLTATDDISLTATTGDINLSTPSGNVVINGSNYPPVVPADTLSAVLTAGNTATNSVILNNTGTGTNVISLLPNASASNPQITLTDGTTTNTIDKNGYTTRNTTANLPHYLNFSDNSTTGTGSIQKTAGISCNPNTNTITATTFSGDLSGNATTATTATNATNAINCSTTSTTTAGTYYPVFVSSNVSGNYPNLVGVMTYNPSTNAITANTFNGALSGTATRATNIAGGLGGQIPYQSAVNTTALLANGTAGQVLTSAGTTLAPTWTTISAGSNASTINITDTTTTAGTYYPTFVSATGSTQTLRADSQYLRYNPSTNYLQNPSFLVSNGTETSTTGGLLISTSGIGSKSIYSTTTTGATENALTIQTTNSGNASSGIYEIRQSGTGSGNGVAPLTFPLWSLQSSFFTPVSPVGTPYSTGNYYMYGSVCNMVTQLTPNGGENGIVAGFQTSIGDNNGYADMYYNTDQYSATNPYILRLNSAGLLAYGTGTAGTYAFGSQNPSTLATTLFSVDSAGITTTNSVTLSNAPTTANQASRLGQVGLVKIGSVSVAITGSASAQNLSFANLFNSSYKNYRIILEPTTQVSFTQYPTYSLQAFLGTGTLPTVASLYGFEMISSATTVVSPVYTAGATISSSPLTFAVSSNTNKEVIFDIQNVGYANTATQQVSLMCKSVYGNPGVSGASDRTITCSSLSGATITGLVIQQSILTAGNNFTLRAVIYGYNQL